MKRLFLGPQAYLLLFALALIYRGLTALPVLRAGYMDASYTVHVAGQLTFGRGLVENVLWNYLDRPAGIPHPSNLYWLPVPALLAAPFTALFGWSYRAAQIPFVFLSAFIPLLAFALARRLYGREDYAWLAGLLTLFSGFYTIYWVSPDNFAPFALAAASALLVLARALESDHSLLWLLTGFLIGLAQLSRADGILLLAVVPAAWWATRRFSDWRGWGRALALTFVSYAVVMLPWFWRNMEAIGAPLPPGSLQTVFLQSYDEFFRLDVQDLTLARYLGWGLGPILKSKLDALSTNFLVVFFGVFQIFLAPFVLIAALRARCRPEIVVYALYSVFLYLFLSLVFTFPSMRGSMLHSSAALVPFAAALAPAGLDAAVAWIAQRRKRWEPRSAQLFFRGGLVTLAAILSLLLFFSGVSGSPFGGTPTTPLWNLRDTEFAQVGAFLDRLGAPGAEPVLTMDPPSFANDTGRRSIVVPTDGTKAVFDAAARYGARFLVLQYDHPRPLDDLYRRRSNIPGLELVEQFHDGLGRPTYLYRIDR